MESRRVGSGVEDDEVDPDADAGPDAEQDSEGRGRRAPSPGTMPTSATRDEGDGEADEVPRSELLPTRERPADGHEGREQGGEREMMLIGPIARAA